MSDTEMKRRLCMALEVFEEWNDCTGFIPEGSSYHWELEAVIEDAVYIGMHGKKPPEGDTAKKQ